jgi:hypothetical protein
MVQQATRRLALSLIALVVLFPTQARGAVPSSQAGQNAAEPDSFGSILESAERNEQSDVGMEYLPRFSAHFGKVFAGHMTACLTGQPPTSKPITFTVLLELNPDGKVSRVRIDGSDALPSCLAERMKSEVFPPAPRERFWLPGRVRLGQ